MLSKEVSSTIFKVFGTEPRSPGSLANNLPTRTMSRLIIIIIIIIKRFLLSQKSFLKKKELHIRPKPLKVRDRLQNVGESTNRKKSIRRPEQKLTERKTEDETRKGPQELLIDEEKTALL